ncbi:TetR/AcrR family transcriptional regulator [Williamsia sp. DF01-3]|uniref:TetR/AcrR family transcriptional regulator n=1 Tax=Williamsia sp. DF01-3 TaxID=2934157 RepID=UPI001FF303F3|nr:TetR/AcrR family transcriptional regulator [Williamsia sp. DF01-3]MCK0517723.1 TetR/AcrR family transcriptional regulator [Williamsia sp. DF01-3]
MTVSKRTYRMGARARAAQQTREHILDAATALFNNRSYGDVTIADIAAAAGVSGQTITNHFGSKDNLYLTGISERFIPRVNEIRSGVVAGDVASIVDAVLAGYEESGESTVKMLAQADTFEALADVAREGRKAHHRWISEVFEPQLSQLAPRRRERLQRMLCVLLDVHTWHQLRRQDGLTARAVRTEVTEGIRSMMAGSGVHLSE